MECLTSKIKSFVPISKQHSTVNDPEINYSAVAEDVSADIVRLLKRKI